MVAKTCFVISFASKLPDLNLSQTNTAPLFNIQSNALPPKCPAQNTYCHKSYHDWQEETPSWSNVCGLVHLFIIPFKMWFIIYWLYNISIKLQF